MREGPRQVSAGSPTFHPPLGQVSYLLSQPQWSCHIQQKEQRRNSKPKPSAAPGSMSRCLLEHSVWAPGATSASMDTTLLPCQVNSLEENETCSTGATEMREGVG